jgi:predicted transcriptional regulator/DNA-binding transcriptional ArsR family regulator
VSVQREKSLEELRKMSSKELARYFNLSLYEAYRLKGALRPERYNVLADNTLTISDMAKKLGIKSSTVEQYRKRLTKLGLAERKIEHKGIRRQVREILDGNPLTFREIREKVEGVYPAVLYQEDIVSIGPKRKRLYCLKGQENLAYSRLLKMLAKPSNRLLSKEELLLNTLSEPMSYKDLTEKAGLCSSDIISRLLRYLETNEKIRRFKLCQGGTVRGKFTTYELFGNLANQLYFYKPGQEKDVAGLIIQNIPPKEKMDVSMRKTLTHILKRCVPKPVFYMVYMYYTPAYDILMLITSQNRGITLKEILDSFEYQFSEVTVKEYLKMLEKGDMIEQIGSVYKPTQLGLELVKKYKETETV